MQDTELRIRRALAVANDTKCFEMGEGLLARVPAVFETYFPGRMAMVVADINTWRVAGAEVYAHLLDAGIETGVFIIPDREFHAEWKYVEMVEAAVKGAGAVAVAVGSGVINDLCKLSSAHLGQSYVCVPTAASVDGYSSFGAWIIVSETIIVYINFAVQTIPSIFFRHIQYRCVRLFFSACSE